jgi:hypothetical protein
MRLSVTRLLESVILRWPRDGPKDDYHIADIPPSTLSSAPVTNLDSSEAR